MQFFLDSPAALQRLRQEPQLRQSLRRIRLPGPPSQEQRRLEAALNRSYFACGCAQGAVAVQLCLVALAVLWWSERLPHWPISAYIGAVVAASLLGKVLGMTWARWQLPRQLARVEILLAATAPGPVQIPS